MKSASGGIFFADRVTREQHPQRVGIDHAAQQEQRFELRSKDYQKEA